ncbi:hypothetical protein LTR85_001982 [Meristemomyces frigidus]|nr:hypothetical protein LTR85_001982 [Meristemomyces frigidus]
MNEQKQAITPPATQPDTQAAQQPDPKPTPKKRRKADDAAGTPSPSKAAKLAPSASNGPPVEADSTASNSPAVQADATANAPFRFSDLAPELRNTVAEYVFALDSPYQLRLPYESAVMKAKKAAAAAGSGGADCDTEEDAEDDDEEDAEPGIVTEKHPLVLVCRKLNKELKAMFMTTAKWTEDLDLSTGYARNLSTAKAIARLPARLRMGSAGCTSLHINVLNIRRVKLWALTSFVMIFLDDDLLYRPHRVADQKKYLEELRELRAQEAQAGGPVAVMDETMEMENMRCGLDVTYSAAVPALAEVAAAVPAQLPATKSDVEVLMKTIQSFAELCARRGWRDRMEVQRRLFELLFSCRLPQNVKELVHWSFNKRATGHPDLGGVVTLSDYDKYWAMEKTARG